MISIEVHNNAGPALGRLAEGVDREVAGVVAMAGAQLLTTIRENASTGYHKHGAPHTPGTGPGPNVATGDYRRSWNMRTGATLTGPTAVVSTQAPQAARLEYGFSGADSLGRVYNQPAYPHVRPAVEKIRPVLETALRMAVAKQIGETQ